MDNVKISHKLWAIVVSGVVVFGLFGIVSYRNNKQYVETVNKLYLNEFRPLNNIRLIQMEFREIEYRMVGVIADVVASIGSGEHLKYTARDINQRWKSFKASYMEQASKLEKSWVADFDKGLKGFNEIVPKLANAYYDEDVDAVMDIYEQWLDLKPLLIKSSDKIAERVEKTTNEIAQQEAAKARRINSVTLTLIAVLILSFVLITTLVVRSINRPINMVIKAASQISAGDLSRRIQYLGKNEIGEMIANLNRMMDRLTETFGNITRNIVLLNEQAGAINKTTEVLSSITDDQALQSQQVASSATEMSQTAIDMANNSETVLQAAQESYRKAADGKEVVNQTIANIASLSERIKELVEKIEVFGQSSREINNIVTVIQDIADQTNLLALNAAIEAARAGEYGRGFTVVADEVRKLAEETAKATEEISAKITVIQRDTESIVALMQENAESAMKAAEQASQSEEVLEEMVKSSDRVMELSQQVAAGIEEQSAATEEISKSIEEVNMSIMNTNQEVESLKSLSEKLVEISADLKRNIQDFKTDDVVDQTVDSITSDG